MTPRQLLKKAEIYVPIYKLHVYCFWNKEDYLKAANSHFEEEIEEGVTGRTVIFRNELGVNIFLGVFNDKESCLVHELSHVCFAILNDRGIATNSEHDESYAYLIEFLYDKCMEKKPKE